MLFGIENVSYSQPRNVFILGVKVQKGDSQVEIYAENIVTDAGVSNTFLRMLPKEVATKSSKYSVDTPPLNVP